MDQLQNSSGESNLRPRARLLRTFGDELISSETVAVIELVKNAYDADAQHAWVRFQEPLEIGKGVIEVLDTGHGMDLSTILTTWMEPATYARKRKRTSENGRRVLGEKGIGRFASSRLADRLELVTRARGTDKEIRALFDWTLFDDEEKYLDEIKVQWVQSVPKEICVNGTIHKLWEKYETPNIDFLNQGTILRMSGLKVAWDEIQFNDLQKGLSRLISPSFVADRLSADDSFRVFLSLPEKYRSLEGAISTPEIVNKPHYVIKGSVDKAGNYDLTLKIKGVDESKKGKFLLKTEKEPKCGPFLVEIRVWDRDKESLEPFTDNDFTIPKIRSYLDFASGVSIYRDGFRVLPYGEPHNDWLRLDLRRVQNPTRNLSNNQIIGTVSITSSDNPGLRDQSNREGLIAGPAFSDLQDLIIQILTTLEKRRYKDKPRQKGIGRKGIFTGFNLASVREYINLKHPGDQQLLRTVDDKEKDLERRVTEIEQIISRYRHLATLGMLIDTVLHDGRLPLSQIINSTNLIIAEIGNNFHKAGQMSGDLEKYLNTVSTQSNALATLFRKIEPFGGRKRGRPAKVSLEEIIKGAFSLLENQIKELGVVVSPLTTFTEVTVDPAEMQEVLINLLQNSLYWLRQVPKNSRFIDVQVNRVDEDKLEVIFSDSGPGVEEEYQDLVFDPYFSTKPDGVGLGLTIAGEIINDYYDGTLALMRDGPLNGATFKIVLHKRI